MAFKNSKLPPLLVQVSYLGPKYCWGQLGAGGEDVFY
jgi:hypothetical protein